MLALPCLLYSMDLTVLHLAVPRLSADLAPSSAQMLWIIDVYGFLVAGSLITMGTLGDRIGRRRLLLVGAAAFGAASVAAALSTSAEMLIATRALLGIAGATVAPSTLSLIRHLFVDPQQRTTAVGVWVTSFSVGGAIGPLVGGLLLEHFAWGSVFLISVPVMLLILVVGPAYLPEYRDPDAGRLDLLSAMLSLVAVLAVIFGLKRIAQDGLSVSAGLAIVLGGIVATLFARRQLRLADPLIDLRLFQRPGFGAALAAYGLSVLVIFGGFLFLPQYLQLVRGLTPLASGLWTLPWSLAFVVGSLGTPHLVRRARPVTLMVGGLALGAVGFAMFATIDDRTGLLWFATGTVLMSLGFSPVVTLATDLIIGTAPAERAGAAAAISETSAELGGALGIALFGSIGVAVYRTMVGDTMPAGVTPENARTALATLSGALEVAGRLPGTLGPELATTASEAFLRGLRLCAAVSAVGSVALAALVAVLHRGGAPTVEPEAAPDTRTAT